MARNGGEAADRLQQLQEAVAYHNHRYYDLDDPEITDAS